MLWWYCGIVGNNKADRMVVVWKDDIYIYIYKGYNTGVEVGL